jgi:hypothetical protein
MSDVSQALILLATYFPPDIIMSGEKASQALIFLAAHFTPFHFHKKARACMHAP